MSRLHTLIHCRTIPYLNTWLGDPSRLSAAVAYLNTCGYPTPPPHQISSDFYYLGNVMGDRYVKSDENNNIIYMGAPIFYGHSMSQPLPYDQIEMWNGHPDLYMNKLQDILITPDDSDTGYFIEVEFCPEKKIIHTDKYKDNEYMKQIKPEKITKSKKLICDWTDKKKCLVHLRILKFYVRYGMKVDKVHEIISFKRSK